MDGRSDFHSAGGERDGVVDASALPPPLPPSPGSARQTVGRLRRSTLVYLRWAAIIGQSLAVGAVVFGLGYDLPLLMVSVVIGASIALNIALALALPLDRRVGTGEAALQLGYDIVQLAVLLYLTGGMENPFSLLFLAAVVTGATTLSMRVALGLAALVAVLSFGLLYYFLPLPWADETAFETSFLYRLGGWIALMVGIGFTSVYAWRVAAESRRMSDALSATEAVLSHEQKLSALGGLAAAAAHELGTPLATIQVTAKEMVREAAAGTPLHEDAELVLSQAQRCRKILTMLANRGDEGDLFNDRLSLDGFLREVAEPFEGFGPDIVVGVSGEGEEPAVTRRAELLYALKNFTENAADFAASTVWLHARYDATNVSITVRDDGPGFEPNIRPRLGEPYVSERDRGDKRPGGRDASGLQGGGLGLGVFIGKTLVERTGGRVRFSNAAPFGATVDMVWPRDALAAR